MTHIEILARAPTQQQFEQLYRIYKLEYERIQPDYKIENVQFTHDPSWRFNWMSVQHVGDTSRNMIGGLLAPYTSMETTVKDLVFWTVFDWYDVRVT